ncbi:MAG: hypothetical protein Q4F66_03340 [Clostridium sp.]|nr:hypothetical protein [Clostridium sp.]
MKILDTQSTSLSCDEIKNIIEYSVNNSKLYIHFEHKDKVTIDSEIDYYNFTLSTDKDELCLYRDSYDTSYDSMILGNKMVQYDIKLIDNEFIAYSLKEYNKDVVCIKIKEGLELRFHLDMFEFRSYVDRKYYGFTRNEMYEVECGYLLLDKPKKDAAHEYKNADSSQKHLRNIVMEEKDRHDMMCQLIMKNPKDTYMEINSHICKVMIHIQDDKKELYHHIYFEDGINSQVVCANNSYDSNIMIRKGIISNPYKEYTVPIIRRWDGEGSRPKPELKRLLEDDTINGAEIKKDINYYSIINYRYEDMMTFKLEDDLYMHFYDVNEQFYDDIINMRLSRKSLGDTINKDTDRKRYLRGFDEEPWDDTFSISHDYDDDDYDHDPLDLPYWNGDD